MNKNIKYKLTIFLLPPTHIFLIFWDGVSTIYSISTSKSAQIILSEFYILT